MSDDAVRLYGERYPKLARKLELCPEVIRYDTSDEKEAWSLAHGLLDMDEAFARLSGDLIRRLRDEPQSPEEIQELLLEVGEELRHILYHISDSRYFAYLRDE